MDLVVSFVKEWAYLLVVAVIVILILKFLFGVHGAKLRNLIYNALLGFILIYIVNWTGFVTIPSNIITWLLAGAFGIPGVVVLTILAYLHII